jgi:hypothetical protein
LFTYKKGEKKMYLKQGFILATSVLLLAMLACNGGPPAGSVPPAESLMPEIKGYDSAETQSTQKFIADVAGGAAALSGRPDMGALIKGVDIVTQCYQDHGAVKVRAYSNKQDPLVAGAIVILDKKMITDPKLLLQCTIGSAGLKASEVQPCSYTYPLKTSDGEFQVAYVGTTTQVCQDFCTNLKGCQDSQ